jgi:hypothetical protein
VIDEDYIIRDKILIHHINPIKFENLKDGDITGLLDSNNVICVSDRTHRAIHYGMEPREYILHERYENDTAPWR